MEQSYLNRIFSFVAPSGHSYSIREQNGEDDDILSNPLTSQNLMNLSMFMSSIIVDQNFYPGKKTITPEEVLDLPCNDRYSILINSRIHSIGNILEFTHDWGSNLGKVNYEVDLNDFVFNKPLSEVTDEELEKKPEAIPFYPDYKKTIQFSIGEKEFEFDLITGRGEQYQIELPLEKRTANQKIKARNLRLKVNNTFEKVSNFRMFSVKEMAVIRKTIAEYDPLFSGNTKIVHPSNPELVDYVNVLGIPGFFWQEGIDFL